MQSSIRMVFNPRIHPLMMVTQMDDIMRGCADIGRNDDNDDRQLMVRWPYGSVSTQPMDDTFIFPMQTNANKGDKILTVLTIYSHLNIPIEITGMC